MEDLVVPFCSDCKREITVFDRWLKTPCFHLYCWDCMRRMDACPVDGTPWDLRAVGPYEELASVVNAFRRSPSEATLREIYDHINVSDVPCKYSFPHAPESCPYSHSLISKPRPNWLCPHCQLENQPTLLKCAVCESRNPSLSFRSVHSNASRNWLCNHCRFENSEDTYVCWSCDRTNNRVRDELKSAKTIRSGWKCGGCLGVNPRYDSWVCQFCEETNETQKGRLLAEARGMLTCPACKKLSPYGNDECEGCRRPLIKRGVEEECRTCGETMRNGVCAGCRNRKRRSTSPIRTTSERASHASIETRARRLSPRPLPPTIPLCTPSPGIDQRLFLVLFALLCLLRSYRTAADKVRLPTIKALSPVLSMSSGSRSVKLVKSLSLSSQDYSSMQSVATSADEQRARIRLQQIDQEVTTYFARSRFDYLYGSGRDHLLQKVMRIERSPHVRDQLHLLETHVVSTKKRYNLLRTERKSKSNILQKTVDALNLADTQREGTNVMNEHVVRLERGIEDTHDKLEREEAESRMLCHMKANRRDWIVGYMEPLVKLKADVAKVTENVKDAMEELYHSESDAKSAQSSAELLHQSLLAQRHSHAQALEIKAEEYRDRREFLELYRRQESQKEIADAIKQNELDLQAIDSHFQKSEAADAEVKSYRVCEGQAKTQEHLFEKLGQAASAYQITDIVEYWMYLQSTKTQLEETIASHTAKLQALKKDLVSAKSEFTDSKWMMEPREKLTSDTVEKFLNRIEISNENLEVKIAQLATWEMYVSQVMEALTHMLNTLSPETGTLTLKETCDRIVDRVQSLMKS